MYALFPHSILFNKQLENIRQYVCNTLFSFIVAYGMCGPEDAMVRTFVKLDLSVFGCRKPQSNFTGLFAKAQCIMFPVLRL